MNGPVFQPVGNTKYSVRWMDRVQIQSSRQAISAGLSIILARTVILPFLQCCGSGSGFVGSICFPTDPEPYQNVTDPDPYQNVTDPQHCFSLVCTCQYGTYPVRVHVLKTNTK
jgi:hypothetical protein